MNNDGSLSGSILWRRPARKGLGSIPGQIQRIDSGPDLEAEVEFVLLELKYCPEALSAETVNVSMLSSPGSLDVGGSFGSTGMNGFLISSAEDEALSPRNVFTLEFGSEFFRSSPGDILNSTALAASLMETVASFIESFSLELGMVRLAFGDPEGGLSLTPFCSSRLLASANSLSKSLASCFFFGPSILLSILEGVSRVFFSPTKLLVWKNN